MDIEFDWTTLVKDLGPRLYRYFYCSFSASVAEDLVQTTLIRLVTQVRNGRFNPAAGSLICYSFGIAHLVRLEALRKGEANLFAEIPEAVDPRPIPSELLAQEQKIQALRQAFQSLSDVQQQILQLSIDEELTIDEISGILKVPSGTIKSHIHRAKESLKSQLTRERSS